MLQTPGCSQATIVWLSDCFSEDQFNDGLELLLPFYLHQGLQNAIHFSATWIEYSSLNSGYLPNDGSQILRANFVEQALHLQKTKS